MIEDHRGHKSKVDLVNTNITTTITTPSSKTNAKISEIASLNAIKRTLSSHYPKTSGASAIFFTIIFGEHNIIPTRTSQLMPSVPVFHFCLRLLFSSVQELRAGCPAIAAIRSAATTGRFRATRNPVNRHQRDVTASGMTYVLPVASRTFLSQ